MKVKKFRASDRATALQLIREELGPQAMIVQEQRVRPALFGLLGKSQVEILAAIEEEHIASAPNGNGTASRPEGARSTAEVESSISVAAREVVAGLQAAGAVGHSVARGRATQPPSQPGGLSDEGASKLAAILETFPRSGQPVPPAMAASLADLIARASAGEDVSPPSAAASATPSVAQPAGSVSSPAPQVDQPAPARLVSTAVAAAPSAPAPRPSTSPSTAGRAGVNGALTKPAAMRNGSTAESAGGDGLSAMQHTLTELQAAVHRLTEEAQASQLPREAPAIRIAYQGLIQQEIDPGLALDFAGQLSDEMGHDLYVEQAEVERRLVELISGCLSTAALRLPPHFEYMKRAAPPAVVVLVGPTGVGKTTTLAKLASHYAFTEAKKVALVTTDTFRIAAAAQLGTYADILELPLEVVYRAEEIPGAIERHHDADVVLVDTPGCGQRDEMRLAELSGFVSASIETVPDAVVLLTLAAPTKLRDLRSVQQGFGQMPLHGLIFTKLDETSAYGPIVSLAVRMRKPVYYLTTGQKVPNDIEAATVERLSTLLLHGLTSEVRA